MIKLFGTDGIRGKANSFPMDAETVLKIAKTIGIYFKNSFKSSNNILIGKDTRCSGYIFESALVAGFLSVGMNATLLGPVPTPAVAMLTKSLRAAFGVMISASHNPYYDNGLKFFNHQGLKLSAEEELFIEKNLENSSNPELFKEFGKAWRLDDAAGRYIEFVKKTFPEELSLKGLKIVLDCANGAAYNIAEKVFWELGASVSTIHNQPDGYNINLNCGALYPKILQETVLKHGADIGIALDGDSDRLVIIDAGGKLIAGDQVLGAIAKLFQEQEKLKNSAIVLSNISSLALLQYLASINIKALVTEVGDKYILGTMLENGCNLGGEPSGHIIISNYLNTSDALIAALQILAAMLIKNQPAAVILNNFTQLPTLSKNIELSIFEGLNNSLEIINNRIELAQQYIAKNIGLNEKAIVRKSGTENVIRVIVEGENIVKIENILKNIIEIIIKNY